MDSVVNPGGVDLLGGVVVYEANGCIEVEVGVIAGGAYDVELYLGECAAAGDARGVLYVIDDANNALYAWRYEPPVVYGDGGAVDGAVADVGYLYDA